MKVCKYKLCSNTWENGRAHKEFCSPKCRSSQYSLVGLPKEEWYVYYLPEHHYVGVTRNLYSRLRKHRRQGKHTAGHELVWKGKTPAMALLMEAWLHTLGYKGCQFDYLK